MHARGFTLFDTAIGRCGVAWGGGGIVGVQLPEATVGAAHAIPPGRTRTYGELATTLGEPGAARAVGQALGRNPFAIVVPCHRVVAAQGRAGGFSAHGGLGTKRRILAAEGVALEEGAPPAPKFTARRAMR